MKKGFVITALVFTLFTVSFAREINIINENNNIHSTSRVLTWTKADENNLLIIAVLLGILLVLFYCCFCFCISLCMRTMQRENYSKIVHKNRPYLPLSTIEDENGYVLPIPESAMTSVFTRASRPKYVVPDLTKYQQQEQEQEQEQGPSPTFTLGANNSNGGDGGNEPANPFMSGPSSPEYNGSVDSQGIKLVSTRGGSESESDGDSDEDEENNPPPPYNPNVNQSSQDEKPLIDNVNDSDEDSDEDEENNPPPPYNPNVNQGSQPLIDSDEDSDDDDDEPSLPPPPYYPNMN